MPCQNTLFYIQTILSYVKKLNNIKSLMVREKTSTHLHQFFQTGEVDFEDGCGRGGPDILPDVSPIHEGHVDPLRDVGSGQYYHVGVPGGRGSRTGQPVPVT